jgi:hypothetical protein
MKFYYQINADGHVVSASQADDAPEPAPDCTVVESDIRVPGDFWQPAMRFHWGRQEWDDIRSLDERKAAKWAAIKAVRDELEVAPFTWDGSVFDMDRVSQDRLRTALQAPSWTLVSWTLADNTVKSMSTLDLASLMTAFATHVAALHDTARTLRAAIDAATTAAAVEAIAWP